MKILHLIDSLNAGGAERMAVTYANALADRGEEVWLWSTREEGVLRETIVEEVTYTFLNRKGPIGFKSLWKAHKILKEQGIQIIHAHSTSFFFATLLKLLCPEVRLVWHDHYGKSEMLPNRDHKILGFCSRYFNAIFTVNMQLQYWVFDNLKCKEVFYIKNFTKSQKNLISEVKFKGIPSKRIICVANLRVQKDHFNLVDAFARLIKTHPEWTIHLIGKNWDDIYYKQLFKKIYDLELSNSVFYYGSLEDVLGLLNQATIGVLSSASEGLPLALLEYGIAGLPVVITDVGHCREVVQDYGKVVSSQNPEALAEALKLYMEDAELRKADGAAFQKHIQ
nr:glycosyltransferase [Flavobacteriales bacterium]